MSLSLHNVSKPNLETDDEIEDSVVRRTVQTSCADYVGTSEHIQPYGLHTHLPQGSKAIVLEPDFEEHRSLAIVGYHKEPFALEESEVALYSDHRQYIHFNKDQELHIKAKGKLSVGANEKDLYTILKKLIDVIGELTTDQIRTTVNGGAVALAPSGTSPISNAEGSNGGVGLAQSSKDKLKDIADELGELLMDGSSKEMQSVEEQEQRRKEERQAAHDKNDEKYTNNKTDNSKTIGVFELEFGV